MSFKRWFSETIPQSEEIFERAAAAAGAAVERYPHPLPGPEGEALSTLTARLGASKPERVIVIVSGTHGIEGYAGAAIQSAYLETKGGSALEDNEALLMIHQINPWGCAWNRREDHENIDIFRNLVYCDEPFRENPLYDQYEEGLNPRAWEGPVRERSNEILQDFIREKGMDGVITAFRRGQHLHPKGITYHGAGPSWSRLTVEEIGRRHLVGANRIDVLDIHTGFGEFGEGIIISCETPGSERAEWVDNRFGELIYRWGQVGMIPDHPHGPYHIWEKQVGEGRVCDFGLEFGTYDLATRMETIRAATFLFNRGDPTSEFGRKIRAEIRENFYPASEDWRARILETGLDVVARSIRG